VWQAHCCCWPEIFSRVDALNLLLSPSKSGKSKPSDLDEIQKLVFSQSSCGTACALLGAFFGSPLCLTMSCCLNYYNNRRISRELATKKPTVNMKECIVCYSYFCVDIEDPAVENRMVQVVPA
jgi:hypothetical protein